MPSLHTTWPLMLTAIDIPGAPISSSKYKHITFLNTDK